jgi:hypothetical protein
MYHKFLIGVAIIFIFIGCSKKQEINIDKTPTMQVPKKVAPAIKNKGSLYSRIKTFITIWYCFSNCCFSSSCITKRFRTSCTSWCNIYNNAYVCKS